MPIVTKMSDVAHGPLDLFDRDFSSDIKSKNSNNDSPVLLQLLLYIQKYGNFTIC